MPSTVLLLDGSKVDRPTWADDPMLANLAKQIKTTKVPSLTTYPRMCFAGECFRADVVLPGERDVIFQFLLAKQLKTFDALLAEAIEAHFGTTKDFFVEWTPEVESWGLKARGLRERPLYSQKVHIEDFLSLVDRALELAQSKPAGRR